MQAPGYFESVRQRATARWEQLESDPELAGPWHQLFKQVQSPRHVLSELLQNADDAGATEASVEIAEGFFIFTHNGSDFTEEHFQSLCRFGYSNKRALHTIGFRGVGFKSTFSLGDKVELHTPSLAVAFDRKRFTAPCWIASHFNQDDRTRIRVRIRDQHVQRETEKNLAEWLESPVSLLFFKHIRRLKFGAHEVHWISTGPGPIEHSEWMALQTNPADPYLLIRSEAQAFPEPALAEIRQERLLGDDQEMAFPPCKVEIVLGAKGRLYVVLPTGVETELPFASNAPFIQDPARMKIKDPETSPTNRWLLDRIGQLAASAMLAWLKNVSASDRVAAYGLLSCVNRANNNLEGYCAVLVEDAFARTLGDAPCLLTEDGALVSRGKALIFPQELFSIWSPEQAVALFDAEHRPPVSKLLSEDGRQKLLKLNLANQISKAEVIESLVAKHLPKPQSWHQLLALWSYVASEFSGWQNFSRRRAIRVMPVQGKETLFSANEIVRLGEKRLLQSDEDWVFLSDHLLVLNQSWGRFLAEQRRVANERKDTGLNNRVETAFTILRVVDLEDSSDPSDVIEQVASAFFSQPEVLLEPSVRLTQIAAKLGATIGDSFRFVSRNCRFRPSSCTTIVDVDGRLGSIFDPKWAEANFLHLDYTKSFLSCTEDEWVSWAVSDRSCLLTFAPTISPTRTFWNRADFEADLRTRGLTTAPNYQLKSDHFELEDCDFDPAHWKYWTAIEEQSPDIWSLIAERILANPSDFSSKATAVRAVQISQQGNKRSIIQQPLFSSWVLRFRDLRCLRDTKGFLHKPSDLLRRTHETESLMDVEPFVHSSLDTEATRPLLKLLGVRDVPTGPEQLLERLRALSKSNAPPAHEVEKWYRRLDQMLETCSSDDFTRIRQAFNNEKMVFTEQGEWLTAGIVFIGGNDEDVPDAATVRPGVRDLILWHKIGVADRPSADLAIQWLTGLPSGQALSQDDKRRVQSLLARHAARIWYECRHWLSLSGDWVPTDKLTWSLSMQTLVSWTHLHEWVKQRTADFQRIPADTLSISPFTDLAPLLACIDERFQRHIPLRGSGAECPWLSRLGKELCRYETENGAEQSAIRALGARLAVTRWHAANDLETVPYIDGTPAGTPRRIDAVWIEHALYVEDKPVAKLVRAVAQELGRSFGKQEIADAIKFCFDRAPDFVIEYMEENFRLAPRELIEPIATQPHNTPHEDAQSPVEEPIEASETAAESPTEDVGSLPETEPAQPSSTAPSESEAEPRQPRPQPKPPKPSIIERYALANGFRKDGDDRYFHADGSWIAKANDTPFPWQHYTPAGELLRYYWPKDHCLEQEPLQLEASHWGLLQDHPERYALILANSQGAAVALAGAQLHAMSQRGALMLYPATYRLVLDTGRAQPS